MVTLHYWFFSVRIKLCFCKVLGSYLSFVLTPHSQQQLNSTKIAITSPVMLFPCPILPHMLSPAQQGLHEIGLKMFHSTLAIVQGMPDLGAGNMTAFLVSLYQTQIFPLVPTILCRLCSYVKQTKGNRFTYR